MDVNRRLLLRGTGLAVLGAGIFGCAPESAEAAPAGTVVDGGDPTDGVIRTQLQHLDAPAKGWDIYQTRVEIPVGKQSGRHIHSTGPEVGYIVQGDVAMQFDDRPTLILHTGDPFLIPAHVIHNAVNIGTLKTMMLSTYVIKHGKPLVINL